MNKEIIETYEENVQNLKEKMQRGDFSLTPNELYLLKNDEAALTFFKHLAIEKKVNWNQLWEELKKIIYTYDINFNSLFFDENSQFIDLEIGILYAREYINNCFDFGENFEGEIKSLFPLEIYQSLMEEAYQKLIRNSKTNEKIWLSSNLIKRLLKEGKFEIFTLDCHLSKDADIDFILDNFPFHQYHSNCINSLLFNHYRKKKLAALIDDGTANRLPTQTLLMIADEQSDIDPQYVSYLVNRILNETTFGDILINAFCHILTKEQQTQIIEHFKRVGRLDLALNIMSDDISIEKNSEDYNTIFSEMKDGKAFRIFPDNAYDLLQDDTFLEAFVTSGSSDSILFWDVPMQTRTKVINLVFREILNGNSYYIMKACPDYLNNFLFSNLNSILDISQISFNFDSELFLNHVIEIRNDEFQEKIIELILKIDPLFSEKLINKKKYDLFFRLCSLSSQDMFEQLSEESQKQLVEVIKQNYTYLECISECLKTGKSIWKKPIILKTLLSFPISRNQLFEVIYSDDNHSFVCSEEVYKILKEYFVETRGYNAAHLDALKERFGLRIIHYLEDENLAAILKYDNNQFNRLLDLFSQRKMTIDQLRNAYDSVIQYGFPRQHPEIVNSFHNLILSIDQSFDSVIVLSNQMESLREQIKTLSEQAQLEPYNESLSEHLKSLKAQYEELNKEFKKLGGPEIFLLDSKFYKKFMEEKNGAYAEIAREYSNPFQLLRMITSKIKANTEDREFYLDMLHFIMDYYIRVERENYREVHGMEQMASDLSLSSHIDSMDARSKLPKFLIEMQTYQEELEQELMSQGLSLDLAMDCIDYFVTRRRTDDLERNLIMQKHQKIIGSFLKNKISQMSEEERQQYYSQMHDVKWEYDVPESSINFFRILRGINLKHLERILSFDKNDKEAKLLYESLKKSLSKSLAIPDVLINFMAQPPVRIETDIYNLAAFISYYSEIYSAERKRLQNGSNDVSFSLTNIIQQAEIYAATSNVYSLILGSEDARIIKADPQENSSRMNPDIRLREAVTWTRRNYERMEVTVPTFNQTLDVTKTKKLQVIVGNFTNPCNLTHGERTGACMRIGGFGEGLFRFCLEDKNGFHIRFQDPETGEYISRVSGFRNGNTVFLNELRKSCNPYLYSDKDIVEACKRIAQLMIERSQEDYERDGWMPIDNVVLHDKYAADGLPTQNLGISNVREGLTLSYCDVGRYAIVLATSRDDNALVPINFDKRNLPTYLPARDKVVEVHSMKEIVSYIRRIDSVQRLMAGENYEYLEFPILDEKEVRYGFANHDWYLYVDAIGVIHEKIITTDPEAKRELEEARKLVQVYVQEKGVNTNYVI